jgi:hypothetical protein
MVNKYTFDEEGVIALRNAKDGSAQRIGEALERITEENKGHLTPEAVVSAARSPRHVLHRHFDWNDATAAESWRLSQARGVIRSVKIVAEDHDRPLPAFLSVHSTHGTSYRPLSEIMVSKDLQRRVMVQAEKDLASFETRYRNLQDICVLVSEARERLAEKRAAL